MIKQTRDWILMMLGFLYWGVAGVSITLVGSLLHWLLPERYSLPTGRFLLSRAFRLFLRYLEVTGLLILEDSQLASLAEQPGPMIIAPNHAALWDAVFIVARIPETLCIMKGSILRNPVLGGGARLAGYIPNDSTSRMLGEANRRLRQGGKLLIFPEGTRTAREARWINPFQGTVAILARRAKAPVVPVFIRSNTRFFEKGRPLFKMPRFPLRISLTVGDPLQPEPGEKKSSFIARLEQIYTDELARPHPLRRQPAMDGERREAVE